MSKKTQNSQLYPFLKWVGGKTQILGNVMRRVPKEMNNYYEPFIGGGSVFLRLLNNLEQGKRVVNKKIYLNDKNIDLINLYICIKDNVKELINNLDVLCEYYSNSEMKKYPPRYDYDIKDIWIQKHPKYIKEIMNKGKSYVYYYFRDLFNFTTKNIILKSALFLILNKTCFRGLYREGKNRFNVPFGNYENPSIFDRDYLLLLNKILNKYDIVFSTMDFEEFCGNIKKGDFVYFDSPYYPVSKSSFVAYKDDSFKDGHDRLVKLCERIDKKKIKFVLSNSFCEYTRKNYRKYNRKKIRCKRRINSKNPNDSDYEIIVNN